MGKVKATSKAPRGGKAPQTPASGAVDQSLETKVLGLDSKSEKMTGANGFDVGTLSFKGVLQNKAVQIRISGKGWDANVTDGWMQDRIAEANADGVGAQQLQSAATQLDTTQGLVSDYLSSPSPSAGPVIASLGDLATVLGPGLAALAMGSPGATSSWANSDETPIEPGPDKTSRQGGMAGLARFGKMMAMGSLAKLGGQGNMAKSGAAMGGPAKSPKGNAKLGGNLGNKV